MSIEALAMAGVDCIKCTINLDEKELTEVKKPPQYLLAEQSNESETNEADNLIVKQVNKAKIEEWAKAVASLHAISTFLALTRKLERHE